MAASMAVAKAVKSVDWMDLKLVVLKDGKQVELKVATKAVKMAVWMAVNWADELVVLKVDS